MAIGTPPSFPSSPISPSDARKELFSTEVLKAINQAGSNSISYVGVVLALRSTCDSNSCLSGLQQITDAEIDTAMDELMECKLISAVTDNINPPDMRLSKGESWQQRALNTPLFEQIIR